MDFDGTLLDSCRRVPVRCREALFDLVAAGWMYIPVSSRPLVGLQYAELPAPRYVVGLNGAVVKDRESGAVHVRATVRADVVREMIGLAPDDVVLTFYAPESWWATDLTSARVREEERRVRARAAQWTDGVTDEVCKCLALGPSAALDSLEWDLWGRFRERGIVWFRSEPEYLEIGPVGASKGAALSVLRSLMSGNVYFVAVGDGAADVCLLESADFGVAVGNATADVLAVASAVVPTNDECGVAALIEELLAGDSPAA